MPFDRLATSWESFVLVIVSTIAIYGVVVVYTRCAGPRSLATMSSFDFAATVAIGSTVATAANLGTPLIHGAVSLAVLYAAQLAAARLRRRGSVRALLDNDPVLIFFGGAILDDNLRTSHLVESEVWAAVRKAGLSTPDDVQAIVLETTGELSVLRNTNGLLDGRLLAGVRGVPLESGA